MVEKVEKRKGREAQGVGRRRFLRYALGFSFLSTLVGVLTPIIGYLWPPKRAAVAKGGRVLVGTIDEIPLGTGKVVALGDQPVITVNTEQGFRAFSAVCTHLACVVHKTADEPYIHCPCHDGRFNELTGTVISGPPPAPIAPYDVAVEDDKIYVTEKTA